VLTRIRALITAVTEGDEAKVEAAILRLSRSRRWLAPLAMAVGAMVVLFQGLRLVFQNWRLTLLQILPAMWIWVAMVDLKAHALHGKSFHVLRGPILIPLVLLVAGITAVSFFLNAVMAFAILSPPPAQIRPAVAQARAHLSPILAWGFGIGLLLAFATLIVTRWGHPWFGISLGIVIGIMMICYVSVPARLVGVKSTGTPRDKLVAGAVGGAVGAAVCTPPYVIGRIGILLLGSHTLFILGVFLLALGVTLQAGATGAVKAIKMSSKLLAGAPTETTSSTSA
jgi:hypothetical protein